MIMNRAIFKLSLVNTVRQGLAIRRIIPSASIHRNQQIRLSSKSEVIDGSGSADTPTEPPIPIYAAKEGETTEHKRARLVYQSRKRGMLENDLVLSTFASRYLTGMNESQLELYDKLINEPGNDWDIYYWIIGHKPTPAEYDHEIMDMLKEHTKNKDRESRLRQPDL